MDPLKAENGSFNSCFWVIFFLLMCVYKLNNNIRNWILTLLSFLSVIVILLCMWILLMPFTFSYILFISVFIHIHIWIRYRQDKFYKYIYVLLAYMLNITYIDILQFIIIMYYNLMDTRCISSHNNQAYGFFFSLNNQAYGFLVHSFRGFLSFFNLFEYFLLQCVFVYLSGGWMGWEHVSERIVKCLIIVF